MLLQKLPTHPATCYAAYVPYGNVTCAVAQHHQPNISCAPAERVLVASGRYRENIFHQAELALAMIDLAAMSGRAPSRILWNMNCLEWPAALLVTTLPRSALVPAERFAVPALGGEACEAVRGNTRFYAKGPFHDARTYALLRASVHAACGVVAHTAGRRARTSVLYLRRQSPLTGANRNFVAPAALLRALAAALPGHTLHNATTPGAETPFCEQVKLWAAADVVLTTTGAHLVGGLFLRRGALLLEGVPYGFHRYDGFLKLLRGSGVVHAHVLSSRPPADAPQHRLGKDVDVCAEKTPCAHFYRDHSNIVVPDRAATGPAATRAAADVVARSVEQVGAIARRWASRRRIQ